MIGTFYNFVKEIYVPTSLWNVQKKDLNKLAFGTRGL